MAYLTLARDVLITLVFTVSATHKLRGQGAFDRHARMTLTMLDAVIPAWNPGRRRLGDSPRYWSPPS
jgi:hypothetical protein